ncbi:penicillin-binding protein 1C, partial [Salmonella enterica subsp. enterica serovar Enteritidis]
NCRRRLATWLHEARQTPTQLLPEQEAITGISIPDWLEDTGRRVAADSPQASAQKYIVWPRTLETRQPTAERSSARMPA